MLATYATHMLKRLKTTCNACNREESCVLSGDPPPCTLPSTSLFALLASSCRASSKSYALLFLLSHHDVRFVVRAVGVVSIIHNDKSATCTVRSRPVNFV